MAESTEKSEFLTREAALELASQNPDKTYISIHENLYDISTFLDEVKIIFAINRLCFGFEIKFNHFVVVLKINI